MNANEIAEALKSVSSDALNDPHAKTMLARFAQQRLRQADDTDRNAWERVASADDWRKFSAPRLAALRASLGVPTESPRVDVRITSTLAGNGFKVHNLVYLSRAGDPVSANLYAPDPLPASLPGLEICHAHHNPKTHKELQDMGVTWARCGCYVLIPDMLGHGERRHQPFEGRQEYYFRYHLGMQLHLAGESLIGRFAWDLMRGIDVLLKQPGIDASRIVLLGAVAGGGDPAAVAAALDPRIACAVPFNFGGPQPETALTSTDGVQHFSYTGSGGWESTRNLRLSARDGFLPWVIVGGVIPRHLIYAHEFEWNAAFDPVWQRYQKLYGWFGAVDQVSTVSGKGAVTQAADVATHCNQIGPPHLAQIYPAFQTWFGIPNPQKESQERRNAPELRCITDDIPRVPAHQQALASARARIDAARAELASAAPHARKELLRERYRRVLGLPDAPSHSVENRGEQEHGAYVCLRRVVTTEPEIRVPLVLLVPKTTLRAVPITIALAQEGKGCFLRERNVEIARLLASGVAVCIPDLRGCGETELEGGRSWWDQATEQSSNELMLGRTQLGNRLHDLLAVRAYLQTLPELDCSRLALWGESFAPVNPPDFQDPPLRTKPEAAIGEPGSGLLAMLGALFFESGVRAVYARRTLASWQSVFESPFVHLPHDIIVPGIVEAGELEDLIAALTPSAVRLTGSIDGRNREATPDQPDGAAEWIVAALRS